MKMRLSFSSFFLVLLLYSHSLSFAQDIHFNLVNRSPDDPGGAVLGIAQDEQGFLWLATQSGLYKYDGYQYTSYHNEPLNPNSLAADYIECLAIDKAGYIWVGTRVGVDRLDPATGIFTHFAHNSKLGSLISDTVNVIIQDHEGTIWIGTYEGLDKFDNKTNSFIHYRNKVNDPSSLSCNMVKSIYEDKHGTIWVGTGTTWSQYNNQDKGGLNKFDRKTG